MNRSVSPQPRQGRQEFVRKHSPSLRCEPFFLQSGVVEEGLPPLAGLWVMGTLDFPGLYATGLIHIALRARSRLMYKRVGVSPGNRGLPLPPQPRQGRQAFSLTSVRRGFLLLLKLLWQVGNTSFPRAYAATYALSPLRGWTVTVRVAPRLRT